MLLQRSEIPPSRIGRSLDLDPTSYIAGHYRPALTRSYRQPCPTVRFQHAVRPMSYSALMLLIEHGTMHLTVHTAK
jgi:hypothetical protein